MKTLIFLLLILNFNLLSQNLLFDTTFIITDFIMTDLRKISKINNNHFILSGVTTTTTRKHAPFIRKIEIDSNNLKPIWRWIIIDSLTNQNNYFGDVIIANNKILFYSENNSSFKNIKLIDTNGTIITSKTLYVENSNNLMINILYLPTNQWLIIPENFNFGIIKCYILDEQLNKIDSFNIGPMKIYQGYLSYYNDALIITSNPSTISTITKIKNNLVEWEINFFQVIRIIPQTIKQFIILGHQKLNGNFLINIFIDSTKKSEISWNPSLTNYNWIHTFRVISKDSLLIGLLGGSIYLPNINKNPNIQQGYLALVDLKSLNIKQELKFFYDANIYRITKIEDVQLLNQDKLIVIGNAREGHTSLIRGFIRIYDASLILSSKEENSKNNKFLLFQNYPNPFNLTTEIEFSLKEKSFTKLKVYDILGREIKTLISEKLDAGKYTVTFDGNELPSGIYIYKIIADNFTQSKKMILIK